MFSHLMANFAQANCQSVKKQFYSGIDVLGVLDMISNIVKVKENTKRISKNLFYNQIFGIKIVIKGRFMLDRRGYIT